MTREKTREILRKYDEMIRARHPDVEAKDQSGYIALFGYQPDGKKLLEHARFMCQKAAEFEGLTRANRWLGFIQAILLVNHIAGLDEMRKDLRPGPEESTAPPKSEPAAEAEAPKSEPTSADEGPMTEVEIKAKVRSGEIGIGDVKGLIAAETQRVTKQLRKELLEDADPSTGSGEDADDVFERLTGEPTVDSEVE